MSKVSDAPAIANLLDPDPHAGSTIRDFGRQRTT
jgi:hypothetical protein